MSGPPTRVSVVMPVRNEAPILRQAVRSVLRQRAQDLELEILVVDGESTDGSREILQELAGADERVRVLANPRTSIPHGLNIGLAAATGDYVCIFGSHSTYDPDYIQTCLRELEEAQVTACGGRVRVAPANESRGAQLVAWTLSSPFGSSRSSVRTVPAGEVDTVAYPVFKRRPLLECGGYNERLGRNEDNDLNQRLRAAGHRFRVTWKVSSCYRAPPNVRALIRYAWRMGYWNGLTVYENPRAMAPRHFAPGVFVGVLGATLLHAITPYAPGIGRRHRSSLAPVALLGLHLSVGMLVGTRLAIEKRQWWALLAPVSLLAFHLSYGAGTIGGLVVGPLWRWTRGSGSEH